MITAIEVRDLCYRYPSGRGISGISFKADPGEVVCIFGWNGAGKTTLLKVLSTLVSPQAGSYCVCGYDAAKKREPVRSKVFPVFDSNAHFDHMTGRENMVFFLSLYGVVIREIPERIAGGLGLDFDRKVSEYSLGMKRKLILAESFASGREVLLFDEPTLGLDTAARSVFFKLVNEAAKAGSCVVIGRNRLEDAVPADRILLLDDGFLRPAESVDAIVEGMIRVDITMDDRELVEYIPSVDDLPQLTEKLLNIGIPRKIEIGDAGRDRSLYWTDEAEEKIRGAPQFLHGMIRSLVEKYAVEHGLRRITPDVVNEVKERFERR